jgi:hypothetical protein
VQDWTNRIGLTLQFISLWLVTPEIIGQARMTRAADYLRDANARKRARAQKRLQRTVKMVKDLGCGAFRGCAGGRRAITGAGARAALALAGL